MIQNDSFEASVAENFERKLTFLISPSRDRNSLQWIRKNREICPIVRSHFTVLGRNVRYGVEQLRLSMLQLRGQLYILPSPEPEKVYPLNVLPRKC